MFSIFKNIFSPSQYMPHGNCYLWQTPLVGLHLLSDLLIGIAYFSIPAMLIYFVKKRDISFSRVLILFSVFILSCGTGHFLDVLTLWYPIYWLSGIEKSITALVSCYTALELMNLLPQFLALKTPEELEKVNQELQNEIEDRQKTELTLKSILIGTGFTTGEEFFPALVTHLATALDVQYVFIAVTIDKVQQKLETLTFCERERLLDNFEYTLENSPCKEVIEKGKMVVIEDNIQNLLPHNQDLKNLHAESYLGVPLLNVVNEVIGSLCIIDTKPLKNPQQSLVIMQVFANRAAAEIERKNATDNLSLAYSELEDKVNARTIELQNSLVSLQEEITKRKEVENALKREQKQLLKIITNAPVAIAMLDEEMNYIAYSQQWIKDYDLPKENLIGMSFYKSFPELPSKWLDIHHQVLKGESLSEKEDIFEYKGQTLYLSWAFQPWFTPEEEIGGLIIVTQNIESLVKAKQLAIETAKMKSNFLANMSHEIRTPMNGILGIVEILKHSDLSDEQRQYLNILNQSSNHLLFLINDILDFSKLEAKETLLENREFNIYNCLESVLNVMFAQAENKGIELFTLIGKNVHPYVIGDENRLRQIILNLVGNAIKFTEKGKVTIKIVCDSETDNHVKLKFEIIDTGIGISPKNKNKLFNSFSQVDISTSRKYGGTGLGLAICKHLAELMGGEIGVESELEKGSNFWFTANFMKVEEKNSLLHEAQKDLMNLKILIIDSSSVRREMISKQLEIWGIKNESYSNSLEAILKLQKESVNNEQISYDVILVNWENNQTESDLLMYQLILTHPLLSQTQKMLIMSPSIYNNELGSWLKQEKVNYLFKPLHLFKLLESILISLPANDKNEILPPKKLPTLIDEKENNHNVNNHHKKDAQNSLKILVLEDNIVNQKVIQKFLERLGYKDVTFADNGEIGLEKLAEEDYDLIFMDCFMPILDGYETTKLIRQKEKENNEKPIIIIAITANAFAEEREKCLQVGMDDYISKPLDIIKLELMLSSWEATIYSNSNDNQATFPNLGISY